MYQDSWERAEFPRRFWVMRLVWTFSFASLIGLLSLPVIRTGACGADASCVTVDRSLIWVPTSEYAWMVVAPLAGIISWLIYTKRHG